MITVTLDEDSRQPLYEQLYRHIRNAIETGTIETGAKLPSKRKMADHLRVSLRTVENAYAQLTVEGYVEAVEKKAYFVRQVGHVPHDRPVTASENGQDQSRNDADDLLFDLKTNKLSMGDFPFSVWTRLMRESLRNRDTSWLEPSHPQGNRGLRQEVVNYLRQFRSMDVSADQVVLGAGSEYLFGLLTELLPEGRFALEDPNYHKPAKILQSRGIPSEAIAIDDEGIRIDGLKASSASVVLTAPSHHFPLGTVMSVNRRMQLLQWASSAEGRYLIEDDYDSEFRFALKPVPSLHSLDRNGKVIYMNTFTRTLAPSLRIAYIVLPPQLLERYREKLMFYACTVSEFEQMTLRGFLGGGYYERHLNR
ncbi:MAG: PLP-dependent aminotransferase family protein, partial [Xanthomonadaceae bacterium]|nr:PLP-dependent aminotransferase family protein [Xanthomonadaceae bacterium]